MGVDIAEVERIQAAIEKYGETFLRRLYTKGERAYCDQFRNRFAPWSEMGGLRGGARSERQTYDCPGGRGQTNCGANGGPAHFTEHYAHLKPGSGPGHL